MDYKKSFSRHCTNSGFAHFEKIMFFESSKDYVKVKMLFQLLVVIVVGFLDFNPHRGSLSVFF